MSWGTYAAHDPNGRITGILRKLKAKILDILVWLLRVLANNFSII